MPTHKKAHFVMFMLNTALVRCLVYVTKRLRSQYWSNPMLTKSSCFQKQADLFERREIWKGLD